MLCLWWWISLCLFWLGFTLKTKRYVLRISSVVSCGDLLCFMFCFVMVNLHVYSFFDFLAELLKHRRMPTLQLSRYFCSSKFSGPSSVKKLQIWFVYVIVNLHIKQVFFKIIQCLPRGEHYSQFSILFQKINFFCFRKSEYRFYIYNFQNVATSTSWLYMLFLWWWISLRLYWLVFLSISCVSCGYFMYFLCFICCFCDGEFPCT